MSPDAKALLYYSRRVKNRFPVRMWSNLPLSANSQIDLRSNLSSSAYILLISNLFAHLPPAIIYSLLFEMSIFVLRIKKETKLLKEHLF